MGNCALNAPVKQRGFALLGVSLILLVASLIVLGSLNQRNAEYNNINYQTTRHKLNQIYMALFSYAMANNYWPCPASLWDNSTVSTFGAEARATSTTCTTGAGVDSNGTVYHGMIPIHTLGLDKGFGVDSWGNKIEYYITQDVVGDINNAGVLSVTGPLGASVAAPYVIISRGINGYGAYPVSSGTQNTLPPSGNVDENQNLDSDNNFVIAAQDSFDDILNYLSNSGVTTQNALYNN